MKKGLFIAGIALLTLGVLSLLLSWFWWAGGRSLMDGSPAQYRRLHGLTAGFFAAGLVLAAAGGVLLLLYARRR